ncbi:MAG: hypothetical protein AAGI22_28810 [Planctomycetota bacterium]
MRYSISPTRIGRTLTLSAASLATVSAQTPLYEIDTPVPGGEHGAALTTIDDLDGDGVADFVVSAPREAITVGPNAGRVGVVRAHSGRTGAVLWRTENTNFGSGFGVSLATIGDVDQDGVRDLIVGHPGDHTTASFAGRVVTLSGANGAFLSERLGLYTYDQLGSFVASADDHDGDGIEDWLVQSEVGAFFDDRIFLISSATSAIIASWPYAAVNASFAQLGDLDGDGIGEIAYTSPTPLTQPRNAYQLRIVSGATLTVTSAIVGQDEGQRLGQVIVGLSDIDGDGVADVAASSRGDLPPSYPDPRVYFFSGATGALIRSVEGEPPTGAYSPGFGRVLSSAGDYDRDGIEDVAAIDPFRWSVLIFSGRTGLRIGRYPETGDLGNLRASLTAPGDLNGDGFDDLVAGAAGIPNGFPPNPEGHVIALASAREITYTYCDGGRPNSTGTPARIGTLGSTSIANASLRLVATELPPQSFGYFLVSESPNALPNPGGPPVCLGGSIGRFVGPGQIQSSGLLGRIELPVNLTNLPSPLGPFAAQPLDTLYFQCWHRDLPSAGSSNLTNALGLVVAP